MTWDVTHASYLSHRLEELLKDGWEPFAVTESEGGGSFIWLRRAV